MKARYPQVTMNITMLKCKIHNAVVTGTDTRYEGSIVIDEALMEDVGLHVWEKVLVANVNTGDRFETYAIKGVRGSGEIQLNGATARLGQVGDRVIIFAFVSIPEREAGTFSPKIVTLDEKNRVVKRTFAS
ncbi:MAG: panD [Candidatus Krumholzibacteriota bacterium]|nr:panD [Candidatus Krumholzibacteriota bacterium]